MKINITISFILLNDYKRLLEGLVDLERVDVHTSGSIKKMLQVFDLFASSLLDVKTDSCVDVPEVID